MNQYAPGSRSFDLDGPAGRLEALLETPRDADEPRAVAVVCHPHPQHHGTMKNKVVHMLARTFVQLGVPALRFNFRGVGRSEGEYDDARGETGDALAALDWMRRQWPSADLWLGGFSFGAQVALQAVNRRPVRRLVTVAPPVMRFDRAAMEEPACEDWLLVQGTADEIVSADDVRAWADSLARRPTFVMLDGVDHFFHGSLTRLRDTLLAHFESAA